jgi:hypothetical protein
MVSAIVCAALRLVLMDFRKDVMSFRNREKGWVPDQSFNLAIGFNSVSPCFKSDSDAVKCVAVFVISGGRCYGLILWSSLKHRQTSSQILGRSDHGFKARKPNLKTPMSTSATRQLLFEKFRENEQAER